MLVAASFKTRYDYKSYGKLEGDIDNRSLTNPYTYTGREDDGTGLMYYRARYYDPELEVFISEDPLGDAQRYVGGSPLLYSDPLGLWRYPDFIGGNVNIAIPNPVTGTLVGWSGTASLDRYGNTYWSPAGAGIGKSASVFSFSLTANWLNQDCTPSQNLLNKFLTGHGFNITGGFVGGVSKSVSPGNGTATGIGLVSPQVGGSYNYSWQVPVRIPVKW